MLRNLTRGEVLAERVRVARSFYWRLRGMIGRRFDRFDALLFPRCRGIHTHFMAMALDVLFVDAEQRVVAVRRQLPPWRLLTVRTARHVLELAGGSLADAAVDTGDLLYVDAVGWRNPQSLATLLPDSADG